jgi:hypothetical protein
MRPDAPVTPRCCWRWIDRLDRTREAVALSGYFADRPLRGALADRIEKWDHLSKLRLSRSVSVNFEGAARDLGIDISKLRIAVLTTLGTGGNRHAHFRPIEQGRS